MSSWLQVWQNHNRRLGPRTTTPADAWVVAENVVGALQLNGSSRLLDWGCGPAHASDCLAEHGVQVLLYDRSASFAASARERFADSEGVSVLDEHELLGLEPHSLDAIQVCSVLQYLDDDEIGDLFALSNRLLKPTGALALVDVVPSDIKMLADLRDVLHTDLANTGLSTATANLGALALSAARRLRRGLRLRRFKDDELIALLGAAGLSAVRSGHNFKPNRSRHTWLARPRP